MWSQKFGLGMATVGIGATLMAAATAYSGPASKGERDRGKEESTSSVGYVDLNQVSDEVKKTPSWQKMVEQATTKRTQLSKELDEMVARRHLTETESKELDTLQAKAKKTDAETERISKLLRRSDEIDKEFNDLANVEKLSPQQSARLQELSKMRADAGQKLQAARSEREGQLQKLENDMLTNLQNKILKVVSDVAKTQNVEVVVDKQALLFGGRDLTGIVVQKMPKD